MARRVLVLALALAACGCGSRCKTVAAVRTALTSRVGAPNRGTDVEVSVPLARANAVIEDLLKQQPLTVPLDVPDLGLVDITMGPLSATVSSLVLQPGPPGRLRFAVRLRIDDPQQEVTTIVATAEVEPMLTRANGAAEIAIGLGPENVLQLRPELGPDATAKLGGAVTRWLPTKLAGKLPQALVDAAANKLGGHLTGAVWSALQKTLLVRLGELTKVRLRLPDVPVSHVEIHSVTSPELLVVTILSDLPVRAGLRSVVVPSAEVTVRISGSAAAELANWAIDSGHAPQWYTRSLNPSPHGEYRPRFDFIPGSSHPLKVYALQERHGCSYFRVGVRAKLAMKGRDLVVTATDRDLEAMAANPALEAAAWVKYFVTGAIDESKKVAAHTRLSIGGRTLLTQVISADLANNELAFGLQFSAGPPATAAR